MQRSEEQRYVDHQGHSIIITDESVEKGSRRRSLRTPKAVAGCACAPNEVEAPPKLPPPKAGVVAAPKPVAGVV